MVFMHLISFISYVCIKEQWPLLKQHSSGAHMEAAKNNKLGSSSLCATAYCGKSYLNREAKTEIKNCSVCLSEFVNLNGLKVIGSKG